jgi:hypothetical protein
MGMALNSHAVRTTFRVLSAVLIQSIVLISASAQTRPFELVVDREPGLIVFTFRVSDGTVRVNLPDELNPGERVSGTVVWLKSLSSAVDGYSLEFAGQRSTTKDKTFQWTVPITRGGYELMLLKDILGRVSATAAVPLSNPVNRTWQYPSERFPNVIQAGGTATILGDFDGDSRTSTFELGDRILPVLVECSRYAVVQIPTGVAGVVGYRFTKGAVHKEGTVTCIQITLQPGKRSLRNGESSTLVLSINGLKGLTRPVALKVDNRTPSLATIRKDWSDQSFPYIWIWPEQLNPEGSYRRKFGLDGIQPGVLDIQAHLIFPQTQMEEVAMILRQPRRDFAHSLESEHAKTLRALPYDPVPILARLLAGDRGGYEAANAMLELDPDNGLAMVLANMPVTDSNVQHVAFSRFLSQYFRQRRVFVTEAHDAAKKALQAETTGDAAIEALWILGLTGANGDFPLLETFENYKNETQSWQQRVRDAAQGALARLGSARHLGLIKQELIQANSDTFQAAARLDQVLEKAGFAGSTELIDVICPHLWAASKKDYDLIAVPAESAASALSAIAEGKPPLLWLGIGDVEKWRRNCQARGVGPR